MGGGDGWGDWAGGGGGLRGGGRKGGRGVYSAGSGISTRDYAYRGWSLNKS